MSQFKLSQDELDDIKETREQNLICQFLDNKDKWRFSIGDILIKKTQDWHDETKWNTEYMNEATRMARRYVYVYEDQHGLGFLKLLKVSDGELGKGLICMSDFIGRDNVRFEVDPTFADSVLFGDGEFDIKAMRKQVREKMARIKAIDDAAKITFKNLKEANDFFAAMTPGQKFWKRDSSYKNAGLEEYTFEKLRKRKVKNIYQSDRHDLNETFEKSNINEEFAYWLHLKDEYDDDLECYSWQFHDEWLYATKPPSMEDEI